MIFKELMARGAKMELSLNGKWQFRECNTDKYYPATVPGCNFLDLIDNKIIEDPFIGLNEKDADFVGKKDWEYKRTFTLDEAQLGSDDIILSCKMLDTVCDIFINGEKIGSADNCFIKHEFPVKEYLKNGENEIKIIFYSPVNYVEKIYKKESAPPNSNGQNGIVHIRKPQSHFGWDWGPVLPPSGISDDISLVFINGARITYLSAKQVHSDGKVTVKLSTETEKYADDIDCELSVISPDGTVLKKDGESADFTIENPELWQTYELSRKEKQPLYTVKAVLKKDGKAVDSYEKKIGLRTLYLDRSRDEYGSNFKFVLNGVPLFIKGSNYIPPDSFITRFDGEQLEKMLNAVRFSNMNMLRIWGGGFYESDEFYSKCDEMGILLWQDFQFACQAYPFFKECFLENVKKEIKYNVKRLCDHPSLALWCGNNEIEEMHNGWMLMKDYVAWTEKLFYEILEPELRKYDPDTSYIPGSPCGVSHNKGVDCDNVGDTHLWAVWHGLKPMTFYRKRMTRFCSEFGFESLPDIKTVRKFAGDGELSLSSKVFLSHQKCLNGNDKMIYYIASRFYLPKKFEDYIYLSQITQSECIEDATEHWRRNRGRCNGAMYWQFNDCWPVCSWASYDYYGNYKALQYCARNFNAPLTVSAEDSKDGVKLFVLNDFDGKKTVRVEYSVFNFNKGNSVCSGEKSLTVPALSSTLAFDLKNSDLLKGSGKHSAVMRIKLFENGILTADRTLLFDKEKKIHLPSAKIEMHISETPSGLEIKLKSDRYSRLVKLESSISQEPFSDNFFDLFPNEEKTVMINKDNRFSLAELKDSISVMSLCDVEKDGNPFTAIKNKIKVLTSPINIGNAVWHGRIQKDIDLD